MLIERFRIRLPLLLAMLLISIINITAQSTSATLSGTVKDERDAVVPGALVKISNTVQGFERTAITDENGSFTVALLPPSTYIVTVERSGFARLRGTRP